MRSSLTYAVALLSAVGLSVQQLQVRDSYDYIIAGGGTAGLTVAARLAEMDATVLVVEIGGSAADAVFWDYSQTLYDVPLTLWTGRGLGGSSSMNGTQSLTRRARYDVSTTDSEQEKSTSARMRNRSTTGREQVTQVGTGKTCTRTTSRAKVSSI